MHISPYFPRCCSSPHLHSHTLLHLRRGVHRDVVVVRLRGAAAARKEHNNSNQHENTNNNACNPGLALRVVAEAAVTRGRGARAGEAPRRAGRRHPQHLVREHKLVVGRANNGRRVLASSNREAADLAVPVRRQRRHAAGERVSANHELPVAEEDRRVVRQRGVVVARRVVVPRKAALEPTNNSERVRREEADRPPCTLR
eukprot:TRINITY_DN695_c0_g1_i13.p1 TRINITY_DN695_c0_g1~~TRINITY_DN695_c0_g1_i13.p1  ORF type:complete len:200 (+),score=1.80 TRINITY_DN695_c0_g1_i13:50-649(+)